MVGEHERGERAEPLPALHLVVYVVLHRRAAGVAEDGPVAERPRPGLAATLVHRHDAAALEQVDHRPRQVVGLVGDQTVGQVPHRLLDLLRSQIRPEVVVDPPEIAGQPEALHQPVERAPDGGAAVMGARWDEHVTERRLAQQPPVRGAVEATAAGEHEVVETGLLIQPCHELHERVLPDLLPGGGEVGAGLEGDRVAGPSVGVAVGEQLHPLVGDEDLVAAHLDRRQPEGVGVAEGREAHDLALVALTLGPQHLRQQRVEAAQPDRALPVAVPQLLGEALDPAAPLAPVEGADLEQVG